MIPTSLQRRHVFYVSGFDPRGPAFYRRLYQTESRKQAALSGVKVTVTSRERQSTMSNAWNLSCEPDGATVDTRYEFLRWDDIVRNHWQRSEWLVILAYLRTFWIYLASGTLLRVLRLAWPPFVTGLAPLAILFGVLGGSVLAVAGLGVAAVAMGMPMVAGCVVGGAVAAGLVWIGRQAAHRLHSYWLLRIYDFSVKQADGKTPDLEARLDAFAQRIVEQARNGEQDELLIVGHSTGATMALAALARALRLDPGLAAGKVRIGLVTLGHCVPMLSLLPQAQRFRDELAVVAGADGVDWVDFTAPTDGACFAFVDVIAASGIDQSPAMLTSATRPKLLSPRFPTLFSPARYARMRRDWYRNHFQYLMAGEQLGEYDYFAITAGALSLGERYRGKSSITQSPLSKVFA
ncbi:MAG: hypothetical protein JWQ11_1884 [Rhizobacter sp.]|nr:hypothetical protein [Rhizobacter sp.]